MDIAASPTVTELLMAQAGSSQPGLRFEGRQWIWREHVSECARYAAALRRRFSASGFLPDVRAFGATCANYVGKPLSYVLATPARPDDADNPLRIVYGNEGAPGDLARFAGRFGCQVIDGFGSTEGGVAISRTPDTPPGALGKLADGVAVLDPATGRQCPPARFSAGGELLNPAEAVGEIVDTRGAGLFAGYHDDAEADASRMRGGMYWSGDLGYADSRGFCWFAGRQASGCGSTGRTSAPRRWSGPCGGTPPSRRRSSTACRIRWPAIRSWPASCCAAEPRRRPREFGAFLAGQGDLGRKQHPRFIRVASRLPRTATFKVLTRVLAADRWNTSDPVWWCPDVRAPSPVYVLLDAGQAAALDAEVDARRRARSEPNEWATRPGGRPACGCAAPAAARTGGPDRAADRRTAPGSAASGPAGRVAAGPAARGGCCAARRPGPRRRGSAGWTGAGRSGPGRGPPG